MRSISFVFRQSYCLYILIIALVVLLAGSSASAVSGTSTSLADSNISDTEIITSQT